MDPVTTIELMQVVGIAGGAMAGLMGVFAGIFIWAANVRDKVIAQRMQAVELRIQSVEQLVERRYQETVELVERRHQETVELVERRYQETVELVERRYQETVELVERRHQETMNEVNRLRQEMMRLNEEGERRHGELLRAIVPLYRHTHADDGQPIVPLPEVEPSGATAAPADN